ncbi:Transcription factor radR [Paramyrothecium foliicola]|nr:Transcription factor radR [Paramyrothecium foliicola]
MSDNDNCQGADLARKRQRNRLAQRKYRKKLKLRIEELEKRAAAADQLPDVDTNVPSIHHQSLTEDEAQTYFPFNVAAMQSSLEASQISTSQLFAQSTSMDPLMTLPKTTISLPDEPHFLQDLRLFPKNLANGVADFGLLGEPSWSDNGNFGFRDTIIAELLPTGPRTKATHLPKFGEHDNENENLEESKQQQRSKPRRRSSSSQSVTNPGREDVPKMAAISSAKLLPKPTSSLSVSMSLNQETSSINARIDHVLQAMQLVKFDSPDEFMSAYYTEGFRQGTAAKTAQETSRMKGLPQLLHDIQIEATNWSSWESHGYKDIITKSAAQQLLHELGRLSRKKYSCEVELQRSLSRIAHMLPDEGLTQPLQQLQATAAELKKTLQDEVSSTALQSQGKKLRTFC